MRQSRRKFLKISSVATASLTLFGRKASALDNSLLSSFSPVQTDLGKLFISPPFSSRSSCYWWWFNGRVDKEGITRDLEEFRDKGIGEVIMINTGDGFVPYPKGAKFLSDEWKEMYRHAMKEAKRLGIGVGVNLSSGWCMGGPWITPEFSGRWYLQSELVVNGPQKFSGTLPLPGNRTGYDHVFNPPGYKKYIDLPLSQLDYRDTAIVAIPDIEGNRISGLQANVLPAKANRKDMSNGSLAVNVMGPTLYPWENKPTDRPVPLAKVIDLTNKVDKDGNLNWDVPAGKWKIIRTGHRMTGSKLMIAQPEADGLSVDWYDKKGVDLQFENLGRVFLDEAAKVGAKPLYFHDDSFEDGFPNWTTHILKYFKEYRGYDAAPYLPVLSGYIIGSAEISDRFLNDYRKTLADCMADRHYKHFADLCHKEGILVQNESAGPSRSGSICIDGLKNLGRSDFPMGEFWLGPKHEDPSTLTDDKAYGVSRLDFGQNKVTKMVASAAHIYGKETVSAEAFTTMRHWLDYPGSLKQSLDRAFCEGVNRITIHATTSTRPSDGKPGYEYGAGTHINPNETWWEKSGAFFDYVARSQHLLRAGKFVADVLFYNGDTAPNLPQQKHIDPRLGQGYDYDDCNEEVLLTRLSVRNKRIVLPDGMSYRILVLPDNNKMPLAVITKIRDLVKAGATVIGPKPATDSGLKNYPKCDTELKSIANQLWGKIDGKKVRLNNYGSGRVFFGESIRNVLLNDGVQPDFEYSGSPEVWIDFIHRTLPEGEVYFITNRYGKTAMSTCTFRNSRAPQIWDPVTAKMTHNVNFNLINGRVEIPLKFEAFQSFFIVFANTGEAEVTKAKSNYPILNKVKELTGAWQVAFDPKWGGPESIEFAKLQDWSKHANEGVKYYSGKAVYTKTFNLDGPINSDSVYLDLGVVKNIADVTLNGKNLGIVWTAPWRIDISSALKEGENKLSIEVINLWPNRLIGDAALPPEKRLTNTNIKFKETDKLLPSGLLGPVVLMSGSY